MSLEATPRVLAVLDEHNSRSILFRLPAEFVQYIFDLAYRPADEDDSIPLRLGDLLFLDLAMHVPDFPSRVRSLKMFDSLNEAHFLPSDLPAFASFAGRLTNLVHIRISTPPFIAEALFAALRNPSIAPGLRVLDLVFQGQGWRDPLDPRHWSVLTTRTGKELAVNISESFDPLSEPATLPPPPSALPSVEKLILDWRGEICSPSILSFVGLFTHLTSLDFDWADNVSDLPLLLRTFPSPSRLQKLVLPSQPDEWDLSAVLPSFDNLESLSVSVGYNTSDPSFYATVANLARLQALELYCHSVPR
ncbi:hypothetical protein JCM8547_004878 [Rhodosporidiobolus lusitaniae]